MSAWSGFLDVLVGFWARVEALFWSLVRRLRRRREAIVADARQLGQEAIALGIQIWDRVDDLPFVPSFFKIAPVRRQFYGHGAFMGAAPALLGDPRWRRILAFLMPDVYEQIEEALRDGAGPPRLIPMFENNPVMCAFGVCRAFESRGHDQDGETENDLSGMEWDVFVDGEQVKGYERAPAERREGIIGRIVDTMVIAHASSTDTVQEAIGLDQYADVRKTKKTGLGGVESGAWLDLFARSLELARADDVAAAIRAMAGDARVEGDEECTRHTFVSHRPASEAIRLYRERTGRRHLGVILEIKSLRSTPALLRAMTRELNRRGIHVAAVCSFILDEVRGVSAIEQHVDGEVLPGPREILFFHYAGDLQEACDEGRLPSGQSVLFNGASLLDHEHPEGEGPAVYSVKNGVVAELGEYRERHGLHIGLYVQEGDCDEAAAGLLSDLVATRSDTFDLGFAWGGLRDEVAIARGGDPHLGYGSQRKLELVGKARQWEVKAEPGES